MAVGLKGEAMVMGGVQWSDMLQGCYHSNGGMGQRVAMVPRSQGRGRGGGRMGWEREVSSPAILGVLIINGVFFPSQFTYRHGDMQTERAGPRRCDDRCIS